MGKGVDRFIVHESEQADSLRDDAGIDEKSIVVIPHGVEVGPATGPPPERPFTIGTFGYLTPYKDPGLLLRGFSELRSVIPEARLRFSLSRHPRRRSRHDDRSYQEIMRRASSIEGVETLEHVAEQELPAFLHACDLIVLPYRYAVSASGVAATAIGAGVPVLAPEDPAGSAASRGGVSPGPPVASPQLSHGNPRSLQRCVMRLMCSRRNIPGSRLLPRTEHSMRQSGVIDDDRRSTASLPVHAPSSVTDAAARAT